MKCGNCGHQKVWHLSGRECMYPGFSCGCQGMISVAGYDALSLAYFTGIGGLLSVNGILNIFLGFFRGAEGSVQWLIGIFSLCFGIFFISYLNLRGQRIARQKALESNR